MHSATVTNRETFADLIHAQADVATLARHLDGLERDERVAEVAALPGRLLAPLYQLAAGAAPLTVDDFFAGAEGETLTYLGRNSMPLFTMVEKRFVRHGGELVGINVQTWDWATGPGWFTVLPATAEREMVFDYDRVPATTPAGWPTVRSNARGLSHLVFKHLHDYCRRVSRDVLIGSATRLGKPMDTYFVLARAT